MLRWRGQLPTFFDLFEIYGGPWSARLAQSTFIGLLFAFFAVNALTAWAAWLLWNGSKLGAVRAWRSFLWRPSFGSASHFPIPWLLGAVRVVLIALLGSRSPELSYPES